MPPNVSPTGLSVQLGTSSSPVKELSALPCPAQAADALPAVVRASPKCGFCGQIGHRNSVIRGKFTCPDRKQ